MSVKIVVKYDKSKLNKIKKVVKEDNVRLAIHNMIFKEMTPYVPFSAGILFRSVDVTPEHIKFTQPYSHYVYEGVVYGPNIPIVENGVIVGYFSPKGKGTKSPKKPTQYMEYDTSEHPLATRHWDKVMMRDKGKEIKQQVSKIVAERIGEEW